MSQLVGLFAAIGIIAAIALVIWIAADATWTEIKMTDSVQLDIDEALIEAIEETADDPDTIWDDPRKLHTLLRELILLGAETKYIELCRSENQQELFDA